MNWRARIAGACILIGVLIFLAIQPKPAAATTNCTFTVAGTVMTLNGNCTTDETISIPNGFTLNGNGHTITAVNTPSGTFVGAVVQNAGAVAHVTNLTIQGAAGGLDNACSAGMSRLRGILFDGAGGSITNNTVLNIRQPAGLLGCQEGNAIEVRNAPFDGTHPNTRTVTISGNIVSDYQKTGIVANGDVAVAVTNNYVVSANLPTSIAANSVQMGFGAMGAVNNNVIEGNQWDVISDPQWIATAVLVYLAGDVAVNHNRISGTGTDVGVAAYYSGTVNVMNNVIQRTGPGGVIDIYSIGVDFYGNSGKSKVVNNTFSGWNFPFLGEDLSKVNSVTPP